MLANQDDANIRINRWLERIVAVCISLSVTATATFQWQLYKKTNNIDTLIQIHDSNIIGVREKVVELEQLIHETRAQMVGWDTLKRIELFLTTQDSKQIDSKMANALKIELQTREHSKGKK